MNLHIQLNGTGIDTYREVPYQGTVSTTKEATSWETFILHRYDDGTVSFESCAFPNVFLSMDGSNVPAGVITFPGGGSVAAQYTARGWEKFHIRRQDTTSTVVAIESAAFPERFLRSNDQDGHKVVNVQGRVDTCEKFEVLVLT